jgi:anti-sigma regulatory factor (Ser/Thr protein kinase)
MQLTVAAALDSLSAVSDFVKQAAVAAGLNRGAAYQLRLSVIELVTNTITHGYAEVSRSGTIELRAEMDDRSLTLTLEDSALPYDPSQTPPPQDLSRPVEERQVGGLGVFLALQGVDSFHYERVGDRNRSVLVMKRPGPSPAG